MHTHTQHYENRTTFEQDAYKHISTVLNQDVRDVSIQKRPSGQPYIHTRNNELPLSISHTDTMYAFAFSAVPGTRLGIDIEKSRVFTERLLDAFLSLEEQHTLTKMSSQKSYYAHTVAWTAKEAYLKAIGTGLSVRPRSIVLQDINPTGTQSRLFDTERHISASCKTKHLKGYILSIVSL